MNSNEADNPVYSRSNGKDGEAERFPIAVIGASAGGLEAYKDFCRVLPRKFGVAFILLQHFDAGHENHLSEILSIEAAIPVREIRSGERIAPDHIYVTPSGMLPSVANDVFSLTPQGNVPGQHLPINFLMRSLAEEKKDCAIGIILSGTGTDGTLGLASIKAEGGLTFAQEPSSAEYDAMPRSAIDSGCVDFVLSPAEIAKELLRLQGHPYLEHKGNSATADNPGEEILPPHDTDLAIILEHLHKVTTVNFREYKPSTLCRRALRRAAILRLNSLREYAGYLTEHSEECVRLYDDVLISVTNFFRDAEVFDALKTQILPAILKEVGEKGDIRLWVPGCSTGEEAYSLAILLKELLGSRTADYHIQIFGTDLSEKAIQHARAGFYSETAVTHISPDRLQRFFIATDGGYRIEKSVRDMCIFARHNLAADPPFSQMHLVTCRNLLIYLQPVLQKRIIPMLHYALQSGGFLVLGGSESVSGFPELFSPTDKQYKIYAKKASTSRLHFDFVQTYSPAMIHRGAAAKSPNSNRTETEILIEADRLVLTNHAPVGVVINAAMDVIQFRGRPAPYLEQSPGKPSLNVLKLARNGLSVELRTLIGRAKKQRRAIRKEGIPFEDHGHSRVLNVTVTPLGDRTSHDQVFFLILLEEAASRGIFENVSPSPSREKATSENLELKRLRSELTEAQNALRAAVESEDSLKESFSRRMRRFSRPMKSYKVRTKNSKLRRKSFSPPMRN